MTPLRHNLRGAAAMALCLPLLLPPLAACVRQNGQLDFTQSGAVAADEAAAFLCPLEGDIPDVGEISVTCPIQLAAFDKWVASRTAGGAPPPITVKLRRKPPARDAGAEGGGR